MRWPQERKLVETKAWSRRKETTEIKNPEPAGNGVGIAAKWTEARNEPRI